jgi:phage terminase large subunit-like protein|nr:MAG TPA: Terminase large subunit [Bacteriophage sp.]
MPISENGGLILQTPMHRLQCLNIVDEIIEGLDERGINELLLGSEGDLDFVIDNLVRDTFEVMYTGKTDVDFAPKYTERLSESIEETLRTHNLTYFITSVLPDFQLSWHHIEWGDLVHRHKKLCIEAARDHGKCEAVGTPVLMFDGRIKKVEEIKVGDLLMGVDSTPRKVTAVHRGWGDHMYRIDQSKGDSYTVNSSHINTCIRIDKRGSCLEDHEKHIVDIDMPTLLSYSENFIKERIRTFKVAWEAPERKVLIEPYFLGYWLGDGNSNNQKITTEDLEVVEYLDEYAERLDMTTSRKGFLSNIRRKIISCKTKNKLNLYLKGYNLLHNKHIPHVYLHNSKAVRLQLLAGLLDSDGDLWCNGYHFGNINKRLVEDVKRLADSLGFRTYLSGGEKFNKQLKRMYEWWGVSISGKIDQIPVKIPRKKMIYNWEEKTSNKDWGTIDGITPSVVSSIKITDVGRGEYVSITTDGDHRFLLGDGTVTHNSYYFSNAYATWKLYGYSKPRGSHFSARPTRSNSNRGYLFSFSLQQSVDLMEILKGTIEGNDVLRERLFPDTRAVGAWASTNIVCKNGARLTCKGFGSSVRGAHPFWIVVDDGLKDNVIYSQLQRQKSIDYFHSVIMNMLVPGGQIVVVGTPFHASDLYGDLKTKKGWFVIEYPAIFPDGRILWPHRWSFFDLLDKRATQGNIIFSRENLCRPITNEASIFPLKVLERSLVRMENYVLVRNRDDFPIKFNKVVVGCDFAISANVGSDYTVFTTWGVDDETGERWLLNFHRQKGMTYNEQIQMLRGINARFRPDSMILEQNTFQQIFVQEADRQGLPVVGHTTGIDKYDLKNGWPGLSADFERGKIHIPVGDDYSRNVKDLIFSDLGSVAFTDKGLQSVGDHDDISSSFWLAKLGANLITTGFKYAFL